MARRTKEDAQATRQQLLQAAQRVFAEKGVSRTSLQDIAQAAGASRGAIYWHFKNKADLFNAMMKCATLPMEQAMQQIGHDARQDPLVELERAMLQAMQSIVEDADTRAIFEIATMKIEYVDELLAVKERHAQCSVDGTREMQRSLQEAAAHRAITLPVAAEIAARGLHGLMVGLIQSWMLAPEAFELLLVAQSAIRTYLAGLGLRPEASGGIT
ncbi:TetR family transcriptional regulator [Rhodoferax sp.]|uniref:TetR family transcriptional regulator n=1 Tax=Rhodoferax sp. TaxID=50421 RepID=UPI00284C2F5B|nr:TetR family transcriptional regulator [Rhodoferax sp.]MDR3370795.1 TetR family transcriptional regulator [Rhodoferax sp.]